MTNNEIHNDQINLIEVFKSILKSKKKIFIFIFIGIFFALIANQSKPPSKPRVFEAKTKIKSLTKTRSNSFAIGNSLNIYNITPDSLYRNFLDTLEKRVAFKSAVRKFEIISKEDYENNAKYEEAVSLASYEIKIEDSQLIL